MSRAAPLKVTFLYKMFSLSTGAGISLTVHRVRWILTKKQLHENGSQQGQARRGEEEKWGLTRGWVGGHRVNTYFIVITGQGRSPRSWLLSR